MPVGVSPHISPYLLSISLHLPKQVGDWLLAMDGVDITEGVSLVDVLDPHRSPHQVGFGFRKGSGSRP